MPTKTEKAAFSGRLRLLMRGTSPTLRGATALARWFNQYYDHNKPVSPQTTHKWLSGRTVPAHDKLVLLAQLFDVDLHWLNYGSAPGGAALPPPAARQAAPRDQSTLPESMQALAWKIDALDTDDRYLVEGLVSRLYHGPDPG